MRARLIVTGVLVMGMITLAAVAGFAGTPPSEPSTDTRQRITLPRAQRDKILAEMRQMLAELKKAAEKK